jgi:hypothetical protein
VSNNEWQARETSGDDWFELFNSGIQPINLGGYTLTDDALEPAKFTIPSNRQYTLAPGGFLLVWADDEEGDNGPNEDDLHVNFKLAGGGGIIALYAPDGSTMVDMIAYGDQTDDVSEGRYTDGASLIYVMSQLTPGSFNTIAGWNTPATFGPIPRQFLEAGQRVTFSVRAFDPDQPAQVLTYGFEPFREGAAVNVSGLFRWIVPTNQPPGDYEFVVTVTDNGVPPRSASASFIFTVLSSTGTVVPGSPPPVIRKFTTAAGQVTLTFETTPGRAYRVLYTDDLSAAEPVWTQLDRDFFAANMMAGMTDVQAGPHRFYRVELLED